MGINLTARLISYYLYTHTVPCLPAWSSSPLMLSDHSVRVTTQSPRESNKKKKSSGIIPTPLGSGFPCSISFFFCTVTFLRPPPRSPSEKVFTQILTHVSILRMSIESKWTSSSSYKSGERRAGGGTSRGRGRPRSAADREFP